MFSQKEISPFQPIITVAELTNQIRMVLEEDFIDVHVVGEISNAKIYPSGHWYFSLKDKEATLPCVAFKTANQFIKFRLEDGLMVVAHGRLSVYPPRGAYQMIVNALEPVGIGDWQLAFEQLKAKLNEEGLFEAERKRPIPLMPKRIGVVTSPAGAAIQDILSALARRNSAVNILISPCRVQGDGSELEIAQAITQLSEYDDIEVIIVARGGGSIEDLWAFNTESVARAVANSKVPVISGVGHETDVTICDFVADMRAPTPTAAAEMVAKGSLELTEKWQSLRKRLEKDIREKLFIARHRLLKASPAKFLTAYQHRLQNSRLQMVNLQDRMYTTIEKILSVHRFQLQRHLENIKNLGPKNVLKRGFAIIRKLNTQEVVRNAAQCHRGEILEVLLAEGTLTVKVEGTSNSSEPEEKQNIYSNITYNDSVIKTRRDQ